MGGDWGSKQVRKPNHLLKITIHLQFEEERVSAGEDGGRDGVTAEVGQQRRGLRRAVVDLENGLM